MQPDKRHADRPSDLAEFWAEVDYVVEWANGQETEVVQPPLPTIRKPRRAA
jgi:hypothetical protein